MQPKPFEHGIEANREQFSVGVVAAVFHKILAQVADGVREGRIVGTRDPLVDGAREPLGAQRGPS